MMCAAVVQADEKALIEHSLKAFMKKELQFSQEAKFLESIYVPKNIAFHKEPPKTQLERVTDPKLETYRYPI